MVAPFFHAWSTAEPLISQRPTWVSGTDQLRLASYSLYEQIFWNVPEAFKLQYRGSDEKPIYLPSARSIVETVHRYLANDLRIVLDEAGTVEPGSIGDAAAALDALLRRERFYSKFNAAKRFGIIRGDWLLHVTADRERPEGARLSLTFVDPAAYFPIYNPEDVDEIVGCHLVDPIELDGDQYVRRLTYRKTTGTGGPSSVTRELAIFEVDEWAEEGVRPLRVLAPEEELPAPIDQLPVYHFKNFEQPGEPFGSSELRGFERLITALNQGISDEDLALALESLGVYVTDAGPPIDPATGDEKTWDLGPGKVVEVPTGGKFERVPGITSVTAYQDHLRFLGDWLDRGATVPDVAIGNVSVEAAESGVALALRMGPLLSRVAEKERTVTDVATNVLFDLSRWHQAYEGFGWDGVAFVPAYGEKLPENRAALVQELVALVQAGIVPASFARDELRRIGMSLPDEAEVEAALTAETQRAVDVIGARMDAEVGGA